MRYSPHLPAITGAADIRKELLAYLVALVTAIVLASKRVAPARSLPIGLLALGAVVGIETGARILPLLLVV